MIRNDHKNRRRKRRWFFVGITFLTFTIAGWVLKATWKPHRTIDPALLSTVRRGDIARSVVATGRIEPRVKVEVKSKASGIVKKIYVEQGEFVRQGQVLLELDREQLEARVREARANLQAAQAAEQAARANYERTRVQAEGPDIPFLRAAFERAQELYRAGLLARAAADEAEKAYQTALNQQRVAQRNIAVAEAEIARARAQVAQAQAALEQAEEELRNSTIASPIDGVVLSRHVEVGDAVSSILVLGSQATLLMTLGDISEVYVRGKVDETDVGKIYVGQPARIVVEAFRDSRFEGRVTHIAPLGVEDNNVITFQVRVSIHNPGGLLRPNMSANAEIVLEERRNVLLIPESALVYDRDGKRYVEVPDPATERGRRRIPVDIGISNGVQAEVLRGLMEGQQVILQG